MKKNQTTSFSKVFLIASFIVLSLNISLAQTTDSQFMRVKKSEKDAKVKKDESSLNTNKSSNANNGVLVPAPIVQPNYEEMSKGRAKAVANTDDSFSKPVPVTYVGDDKKITEVNYTIDAQQTNFDNLTNLIDTRNKVHASENHATLTQTAKYNQLLSDITAYKAKFNADVAKKGFENCSKKEQSLFLSFLKEEGKKEEYTEYINKLKQD